MSNMTSYMASCPTWDWNPCYFDLRRQEGSRDVLFNLSSSITLTNPKSKDIEPIVETAINIEKPFIFSDNLGWNWHKSWNIPNIEVILTIRDPVSTETLLPPQKLYAELYVVKAMINNIENFHLLDVGVKGNCRVPFNKNKCVFSGLKFSTTSYNHEGSKFHIVIVLNICPFSDETSKILVSKISPPIFIDSRKSARDTQKQKVKHMSSFIDPFLPENLDKLFIKRENKKKFMQEEAITNNLEGLCNYFSAPNIRHKVKHPLFLAIKFSQCITLYYNTKYIQEGPTEEALIERIQNVMFKNFIKVKQETDSGDSKNEEKYLILALKNLQFDNNTKNKKVTEFMEQMETGFLQVTLDPIVIGQPFKELTNIERVSEAYKKIYVKLTSSKFQYLEYKQHKDGINEIPKIAGSLQMNPFGSQTLIPSKMTTTHTHSEVKKLEKISVPEKKVHKSTPNNYLEPPDCKGGPIQIEIDLTPRSQGELFQKSLKYFPLQNNNNFQVLDRQKPLEKVNVGGVKKASTKSSWKEEINIKEETTESSKTVTKTAEFSPINLFPPAMGNMVPFNNVSGTQIAPARGASLKSITNSLPKTFPENDNLDESPEIQEPDPSGQNQQQIMDSLMRYKMMEQSLSEFIKFFHINMMQQKQKITQQLTSSGMMSINPSYLQNNYNFTPVSGLAPVGQNPPSAAMMNEELLKNCERPKSGNQSTDNNTANNQAYARELNPDVGIPIGSIIGGGFKLNGLPSNNNKAPNVVQTDQLHETPTENDVIQEKEEVKSNFLVDFFGSTPKDFLLFSSNMNGSNPSQKDAEREDKTKKVVKKDEIKEEPGFEDRFSQKDLFRLLKPTPFEGEVNNKTEEIKNNQSKEREDSFRQSTSHIPKNRSELDPLVPSENLSNTNLESQNKAFNMMDPIPNLFRNASFGIE